MIKVFDAPLNEDLAPFTRKLWELRITHRVLFEDRQILIVEDEMQAQKVLELYQHWHQSGTFPEPLQTELEGQRAFAGFRRRRGPVISPQNIPVAIALLVLSIGLTIITNFGADYGLLAHFTITDFQVRGNQINYYSLEHNFDSLELWRFLSPIFIHFNLPHIVFNGLWIWIVGRVIEFRHGNLALLFIALLSGIVSNIAQYYQTGPVFGGLSGVVYAIISYAWLWDRLTDNKLAVVSNGLMGFMIIWLVLGYSGMLSQLGFGQIANTAHLAGLISGIFAVGIIRLWRPNLS